MRITIKGLTASTIAFNTLGIIIRGDSKDTVLYPNSVARHIDIKTDAQMREVITLKNAGLISFQDEEKEETQPKIEIQKYSFPPKVSIATETITIPQSNHSEVKEIEEVEDAPSKAKEKSEDQPKVSSGRGRGRPKGSTKKKDEVKESKEVKKAKTIRKISSESVANSDVSENSDVVVMTANGPVRGKSKRTMAPEIGESDITKASIDAMKQLEDEESAENVEPDPVDESKLDVSERMGGSAVIMTGNNNAEKVPMKNSILPQADAIKNAQKFIELKDTKLQDEKAEEAFIDKNDDDASLDNMIEI